MVREGLTGTRIRERRAIAGLKQAELARQVGISASYLNLIEHNRRRIGGKLLLDIAAVLQVEPQAITEGAEAALIASLREASEALGLDPAEAARAEELAGRFPGWADVLAKSFRRITEMEQTVETMSDRMAHDPQLAASLHEVLSTAASIRATSSILDDTPDLDTAQQARFHANIHQDSRRLSESAKTLVQFLEADAGSAGVAVSAQEEVESWLADHSYNVTRAEQDGAEPSQASALTSIASRRLARDVMERMQADDAQLSLADLRDAISEHGDDPADLSRVLRLPVSLVMRRLASAPERGEGLIVADRAGALVFRKQIEGFTAPRTGAACALWPVFQSLSQPGVLIRDILAQMVQPRVVVEAFAIAEPVTGHTYNMMPLLHATMLLRVSRTKQAEASARDVGVTCRICSINNCPGRREPSVVSEGI